MSEQQPERPRDRGTRGEHRDRLLCSPDRGDAAGRVERLPLRFTLLLLCPSWCGRRDGLKTELKFGGTVRVAVHLRVWSRRLLRLCVVCCEQGFTFTNETASVLG